MKWLAVAFILASVLITGCDPDAAQKQVYRNRVKREFSSLQTTLMFEALTSIPTKETESKARLDARGKELAARLISRLEKTIEVLNKRKPPAAFQADHEVIVSFFEKSVKKMKEVEQGGDPAPFSESEKEAVRQALRRTGVSEGNQSNLPDLFQ